MAAATETPNQQVVDAAMQTLLSDNAADPEPAQDRRDTIIGAKRTMPSYIKKRMITVQGGRLYLPVAARILWFREDNPDWGIVSECVEGGCENGFARYTTKIYFPDGRIAATADKVQHMKQFPDYCEKSQTGSVGRALGLLGYGTDAGDLDEGQLCDTPVRAPQGARTNGAAGKPAAEVWEGPGQCPRCHAPAGKRHVRPCL